MKLPDIWLLGSRRNASWNRGFKEGEKGQAPNNLIRVHPNWAKAAHLAPLLCKCISWQGASQFLSHHQIRTADGFSRELELVPHSQTQRCVSAAIACCRRLDKHATSTTSKTYRHLSASLNVEMWLLHFQSVHQEKYEHKAVISRRRTSPCSAREAQSQLQQPRKLGWISWRLGENENINDVHRSNTSPDCLQCPIMVENTIYNLSFPEGKYALYPLQAFESRNELPVDLNLGIRKSC